MLEDSLEGQTMLSRGFVGRYVEMWPQRYARLQTALGAGNVEDAAEAALSIFSSSVMVGAERLGQMSGDMVEWIKQGHPDKAQEALNAVALCGTETMTDLKDRYVQPTS
ncbi:hypothetical protein [Arthrobacter sp. UYCu511]